MDPKIKEGLKRVGWFALKTAGISAAVIGGVTVAVPALGFTASGVAAGSLAAAYQSAFLGGTIAPGSPFAVLQSIGAKGLAATAKTGIVVASGAVSEAHTAFKTLQENKKKPTPPPDDKPDPPFDNKPDLPPDECDDKETENEDMDENMDRKEQKSSKMNKYDNVISSNEKDDNLFNEKKVGSENIAVKNPSNNLNNTSEYEAEVNSLKSKWSEVELTDDVTITKEIAKRLK